MRKAVSVLVLLLLLVTTGCESIPGATANDLVILHTNNVVGFIGPCPG